MDSDGHNGKDYPDVPEAQNLDIKNTPTHTKDNKNNKAKPHKKPALLDRPIQKFATKKKESQDTERHNSPQRRSPGMPPQLQLQNRDSGNNKPHPRRTNQKIVGILQNKNAGKKETTGKKTT